MRIICLLICSLLFTSLNAQNHYTKPLHKAYLAEGVKTLKLENKYGNVRIIQTKNDSLSIDVKISLAHYDEDKAKKQIEEIDIAFGNYKKTISAKTKMSKHFNTAYNFNIDYIVSVPEGVHLKITNLFGNIIAEGDLRNYAEMSVDYGNIYVDNLIPDEQNKMNYFKLNYSTAHLKKIYNTKILSNFSKIRIKEANNMVVSSRCSRIEVDSTNTYISNSQNDNCIIKECSTFKIKKGNNSHISLENGVTNADLNLKSGTLSIKNIKSFYAIKLNTENTRVDIDIDENAKYNYKSLFKDVKYQLPEGFIISTHEKDPVTVEEYIEATHGKNANEVNSSLSIEATKGYIKIQ